MFTIAQIEAAHAKVATGADFPAYIRELKSLGVASFVTWVADSHTDYLGSDGYKTASGAQYRPLRIAASGDPTRFEARLKLHQQGGTDYPTFCRDCAEAGVEKWIVDLVTMTCTYFDAAGRAVLEERIPG